MASAEPAHTEKTDITKDRLTLFIHHSNISDKNKASGLNDHRSSHFSIYQSTGEYEKIAGQTQLEWVKLGKISG
jgi:hypothetical protein